MWEVGNGVRGKKWKLRVDISLSSLWYLKIYSVINGCLVSVCSAQSIPGNPQVVLFSSSAL